MRIHWNLSLILFAVTIIFSSGCSNLDSWVRSVENTFVKVKTEAEDDTVLLDDAGKAYQAGNLTLAEDRYKEYIETNQRSGDNTSLAMANSQLGRIAFEKNNFKASNQYFDEAIKLDPDNLNVYGLYGESLYWQKEYHRSETLCHQALRIAPNDRRFQIVLGRTMAQQKQYQAGLRYLKQALGEQGAYEEISRIYYSHSEFDKAALAMSKARESCQKQQQMAANFPSGGVSVPVRTDLPRAAFPATHHHVATQAPPYQPAPTTFPPQQPTAIQQLQVSGQQQNVPSHQAPVYSYQYPQQYAAQQPGQPFPQHQQQPVKVPNIQYSHQSQPQNIGPYYGANHGMTPPPAQPGYYPGQYPNASIPQQPLPPQQVYENYPQQPQDNRPPQGFAAIQQQPMITAPTAGMQTNHPPSRQNNREIAWHPNYPDTQQGPIQFGPMQPGTVYSTTQTPGISSPVMPSSTNPLAERYASPEQSPTPSSSDSATPITGNRNSQTWNPGFSGYPMY